MTNEEIATKATKKLLDVNSDYRWTLVYIIILAAINRAQSEDKARLDWLEPMRILGT